MSDYYKEVVKSISDYKKKETNRNVIQWINEYMENFKVATKHGKILEEEF